MAFVKANFSGNIGAGSGSINLFVYNGGADTVATQQASAYFNDVANIVDAGDCIISVGNAVGGMSFVTSAKGVTPVTTTALPIV